MTALTGKMLGRRTAWLFGGAGLALAIAWAPPAEAAGTQCPQHYISGAAPDIVNPRLRQQVRDLCSAEFGNIYSGMALAPLATGEHLTRERLRAGSDLQRTDSFRADERLPRDEQATLRDFEGGGDRGHMANARDMSTAQAKDESFRLSNIVEQDSDNNRGLWCGIEGAARGLATRYGEAWVVTGPAFQGQTIRRLNGRVWIPSHIYKAIYVPALQQAAAYLSPNAPGEAYEVISIGKLQELTGIDVFPALPLGVKSLAMGLPEPKACNFGRSQAAGARHGASHGGVSPGGGWLASAKEMFEKLLRH